MVTTVEELKKLIKLNGTNYIRKLPDEDILELYRRVNSRYPYSLWIKLPKLKSKVYSRKLKNIHNMDILPSVKLALLRCTQIASNNLVMTKDNNHRFSGWNDLMNYLGLKGTKTMASFRKGVIELDLFRTIKIMTPDTTSEIFILNPLYVHLGTHLYPHHLIYYTFNDVVKKLLKLRYKNAQHILVVIEEHMERITMGKTIISEDNDNFDEYHWFKDKDKKYD